MATTDQIGPLVAEHRRQRLVDVDEHAGLGARQRHAGRRAVEGQAEPLLSEVEVVCAAETTVMSRSVTATRSGSRIGGAHRLRERPHHHSDG